MGTSKTHKSGPGWQGRNTPGKDVTPSAGGHSTAEGTHMGTGTMRTGLRSDARQKSRGGKTSGKNPGPHGYS